MKTAAVKNGSCKRRSAAESNGKTGIEDSVKDRYAKGAKKKEEALCCPVAYDPRYLKVIPEEILAKDYGCGDPSRYIGKGETVLDLGCGAGKICYIASQAVGPEGKVIGVDFNPPMLELARKHQKETARRIGWDNIRFLRGKIQDLKTDLERVEKRLAKKPVASAGDYESFQTELERMRGAEPLISDESVDVIVSNCVLNLVRPEDKKELFREMQRVLRKGGRAAISDIVSDETVPEKMQRDPKLWSGCISGAFQEKAFLEAFREAGFYGIRLEKFDAKPWRVVEGIEFRSVIVTAYKGKEGPCFERNQAVIYKGPWKQVEDDDGHVLKRGARTAVCDKTFHIYSRPPYRNEFFFVEPGEPLPVSRAKPFDCSRNPERDPRETKGKSRKTNPPASACLDGGCC